MASCVMLRRHTMLVAWLLSLMQPCGALLELNRVEIRAGMTALIGGSSKGAPAVIVIQEWWGVNEQIKQHASRIAEEGKFRVLIPDIYKGKLGVDAEEAQHLMGNLNFPEAVTEIADAAAYLKSEGAPKVGVIGFCMGGALTLGSLAASEDITCGVPFYGINFGLFDMKALATKPVQGHFGGLDASTGFSDPPTAQKLAYELKHVGNYDADIFFYNNVGHSFLNDMPAPYASFEEREAKLGFPPYNHEQAELAWRRLLQFFGKHLRPQSPQTEL
eukprot:TRINITY_DN6962_c0_g2_i1.p1 TRINITY_DN6962_c0_g2~~TRINITY_DN6962_c0_g2_i1.p1  ORF type:complete len:274 (+),score=53.93 TRINITY_DN6962_c0_g2_i1:51-872(+)